MTFKEAKKTGNPYDLKLITPDGYVGYYRGHFNNIVWFAEKIYSTKEYPYSISQDLDIDNWEVTETEECNIKELFIK